METLTNSGTFVSADAETKTVAGTSDYWETLEATRYGFAPLILLIIACLGGIAAAFAVQDSEVKLLAVAATTTFVEVLIIAIAPMRMIVYASALALIVDLMVFIF